MNRSNTQPPFDADPIQLAAQAARGRRPEFTGDPLVERLFAITLALTTELAVTRERLDTVERLLSKRELLPREAVEAFRADDGAAHERGQMQQEYLARVFRILLQDQGQAAPAQIVEAERRVRA